MEADLRRLLGERSVLPGTTAAFLHDSTECRGIEGSAAAVCLPENAEDVARVVAWCYERGVPVVPRGGGTGYAGGAVPVSGGVVVGLERLQRVRSFDPLLWRIEVEAGVRTARLHELARGSGLMFPPDPGAAEQSQIGGNVSTNAGGPRSFKYGTTGAWVTGVDVVLPPGDLVSFGGSIRKDAASYRLASLIVGSEGTLGIITSVRLRLVPAPEAALPAVALYPDVRSGCTAVETVLGSGVDVAALEYLDAGTVEASRATFPFAPRGSGGFMVIAEVDGSRDEAARLRAELVDALAEGAVDIHTPNAPAEVAALWRWRAGVSLAVTAQRGGKLSEDIVVPVDRLAEAIEESLAVGARHSLRSCSWGHAGDGNLHSTFMIDPANDGELANASEAGRELFGLALRLGGSVSGEHGIGIAKHGQLERQLAPRALALHQGIKALFDPAGLMNPGKKC